MYKPRKCKECGKEFIPNSSRQFYCKEPHYRPCPVCGKPVLVKQFSDVPRACSMECTLKRMEQTNMNRHGTKNAGNSKEAKEKRKQTCISKYGVENPFQSEVFKEKARDTIRQTYGVDFISQSPEIKRKISETWENKSEEELQAISDSRRQTCIDLYGVENPNQIPESQEKRKETCLSFYGVDHPSKRQGFGDMLRQAWANKSEEELADIDRKRRETNLANRGVEYAAQSDDVKLKIHHAWENKSEEEIAQIVAKREATCFDKYGVRVSSQSDQVKETTKQNNLKKWGVEFPMQLESTQEKMKSTNIDKYGYIFPTQSLIVQEKRKLTSIDKYGYPSPNQSPIVRKHISEGRIQARANTIQDPVARQNYIDFATNPESYVKTHFNHVPTYKELQDSVGGINDSAIYLRIPLESGLIARNQSTMERDIENFIHQVDDSIEIIKHSRSIISPYELDLYLPQYKLGIECNPTYTHNSTLPSYQNSEPLDKLYHKMKTDLANKNGIFLFHIFGYEWTNKQDVIKSMLRHLLGKDTNKYYGRNLQVVELSSSESNQFFNVNHRQGYAQSSIRLGLKTANGEIVSAMTFSKMRNSIGYNKSVTSETYELTRFCNKLNIAVIGGASKLFNYFLKNYNFDTVVSFSDKAHTKGNLYTTLGFKFVSISEPGYVWVNSQNDSYYHRVTCQKQNLPNLFHEPDLDIENQTEAQIMASHGYVQVFDSGVIRWEYYKSN